MHLDFKGTVAQQLLPTSNASRSDLTGMLLSPLSRMLSFSWLTEHLGDRLLAWKQLQIVCCAALVCPSQKFVSCCINCILYGM